MSDYVLDAWETTELTLLAPEGVLQPHFSIIRACNDNQRGLASMDASTPSDRPIPKSLELFFPLSLSKSSFRQWTLQRTHAWALTQWPISLQRFSDSPLDLIFSTFAFRVFIQTVTALTDSEALIVCTWTCTCPQASFRAPRWCRSNHNAGSCSRGICLHSLFFQPESLFTLLFSNDQLAKITSTFFLSP